MDIKGFKERCYALAQDIGANNAKLAEVIGVSERQMRRFRSAAHLQHFASVHA